MLYKMSMMKKNHHKFFYHIQFFEIHTKKFYKFIEKKNKFICEKRNIAFLF